MPLKQLLRGVGVVGAGEAAHGGHELMNVKSRLFRFLVTEMGYTGLAVETSYSASRALDEYVVNGKGRREDVLSQQGYLAWDTQEMASLIDWIREHNRHVNAARKVYFIGMDLPPMAFDTLAVLVQLAAEERR